VVLQSLQTKNVTWWDFPSFFGLKNHDILEDFIWPEKLFSHFRIDLRLNFDENGEILTVKWQTICHSNKQTSKQTNKINKQFGYLNFLGIIRLEKDKKA